MKDCKLVEYAVNVHPSLRDKVMSSALIQKSNKATEIKKK